MAAFQVTLQAAEPVQGKAGRPPHNGKKRA